MKRSNFLATIAAIFLAPFGIKAKSEYTRFKAERLPGEQFALIGVIKNTGATPIGNLVTGPNVSIPYPPIPDDGKEHDICVKYDNGKVEYFVDGLPVIMSN